MKTLRLITVGSILVGIFTISTFAQAKSTKIAVINTLAFGAKKGGIAKYINAQKRLENEFKNENQQLQSLANQINKLKKELQDLRKPSNPNVPISIETINAKVQQHDALAREFKFKQENAKAKYDSRFNEIVGPVNKDIGKAMQKFAKQKGYAMILDAAQLERAGLILAFDPKYNVTEEFIKFYNALPVGTASAKK